MFYRLLENYQALLAGLVDLLWHIADQLNPGPQVLSQRASLSLDQNEYENDSDTSVTHDHAGVLDVSLVHDLLEAGGIALVRFSKDGRYLATARDIYGHNKASIHDVQTGALVETLEVFFSPTEEQREARITDLCFSPDSLCLATAELDGTIRIWDIFRNHVRSVFRNEGDLYSLDFSPNGQLLISASAHGAVHVWNVRDCSSDTLYCDLRHLRTVCFSTDGLHVAAGGLDGIQMWDLGQAEPLQGFDGHEQWLHSLVFTPTGLMSSLYDKTIIKWDISVLGEYEPIESEDLTRLALDGMGPRKEIQIPSQTFKGYQSDPYSIGFVLISIPLGSGIHSVAISRDGRWVLSGSKNPNVCIWDAHKSELHCELSRERKDDVVSVDFSPAGSHIVTAYDDGGVRIWRYEEVHNSREPKVSLI